jgi:hypothetical protein
MRETPLAARDKALQTLKDRLPGQAAAIERAYQESPFFRSVCRDFHECTKALTYWHSTASSDASGHVEEYRELRRELEQEILCLLKEMDDVLDPPNRDGTAEAES